MKHHRARLPATALFTLAMLGAASAHAVQDCEVNGQPVNPSNGFTTQGKTGIMRCKGRDSGQLEREQELRDGKFVGIVRYHSKGQLLREHSVNERGNIHGRLREFGSDGQLLREATYDNGDVVGTSRSFHHNGQLRLVTAYDKPRSEIASAEFTPTGQLRDLRCAAKPVLAPTVDDARLCGFAGPSAITLYRDDGSATARSQYQAGQRLRHETLYDNGAVQQQTETTATQRTERSFSREGVKRREALLALGVAAGDKTGRGVLQLEQEFAASGTLVRERRWEQGELASEQNFYLNGQPRSKDVFTSEGNARRVLASSFHDNGALASEGRFTVIGSGYSRGRQVPQGTHKRFDAKGQLASEKVYDDQGRLTREREWDGNGQLQRDDAVFEDGSRKAYAK